MVNSILHKTFKLFKKEFCMLKQLPFPFHSFVANALCVKHLKLSFFIMLTLSSLTVSATAVDKLQSPPSLSIYIIPNSKAVNDIIKICGKTSCQQTQHIASLNNISAESISNNNRGTAIVFNSIEDAKAKILEIKKVQGLPPGGIEVILKEGEYTLPSTLIFTEEDSGTEQSPIIYRAEPGTYVVITGGIRLSNFKKVSDEPGSERINPEVKDNIFVLDLTRYGISSLPPLELAGFGSRKVRTADRNYQNYNTFPCPELFYNRLPMTIARFPNQGFLRVAGVQGDKDESDPNNPNLMKNVRLKLEGCPLANWSKETNILLYGYWYYDWADSYETVSSVNVETSDVLLAGPGSAYGYREGARYYAINLLCELDQPGEWYIDREHMLLYFYPPASLDGANIELSLSDKPMIIFKNAGYITLENIHFRLNATNILQIFDGNNIQISGCSFSESAGYGITIGNGKNHKIQSCDFTTLGKGGIYLAGGNRKDLTPSNFVVDNCYFYNLARIDHTYNPAVYATGCGHTLTHNLVHKNPSSAFRIDANDCLIEFNEIFDVLLESDDQGGADMWGNPAYRGVVYRYNYWHHIGNWQENAEQLSCGQAGIRLDDAISGVHIYGNIFYHSSSGENGFGGIQIHGGKDNLVENNIFAECRIGISCTPWSTEHWTNFVKSIWDNQDIDKDLYLQRYPELNHLYENINQNTARNNIFWNCKKTIVRAPSNFIFENNLETTEEQLFPYAKEGNFNTNETWLGSQNFSFTSIPFNSIGLYKDTYRTKLPEEIIRKGRTQQ